MSRCRSYYLSISRILLWFAVLFGHYSEDANDTSWPSFRGRNAAGIAQGHATPVTWNLNDGTNILWKEPVPGLAHSSPVVWGDSIFLTSAIGEGATEELRVGLFGESAPVQDVSIHRWCV